MSGNYRGFHSAVGAQPAAIFSQEGKHMKRISTLFLFVLLLFAMTGSSLQDLAQAQSGDPNTPQIALDTSFTYQGRLQDNASPANDNYDLRFILYTADSGGSQVGGTLEKGDIPVSDGYFTVLLDFGPNVFTGSMLWLEVGVRPGISTGSYTTLSPRMKLTAAPNALYAPTSGNADLVDGLHAAAFSAVSHTHDAAVIATGTLSADRYSAYADLVAEGKIGSAAGQLAAGNHTHPIPFWNLGGNAGTNPGSNYIGTSDNQAFELRVNGIRALRIEPNNPNAPNILGGYNNNWITSGVYGATLFGGGYVSTNLPNRVTDYFGTVSGGSDNQAGNNSGQLNDAQYATVCGGQGNTASGTFTSVGGGTLNTASGFGSVVAGGGGYILGCSPYCRPTPNQASGDRSAIVGGMDQIASGTISFIGGGMANSATQQGGVVVGGADNPNDGEFGFLGGGILNQITYQGFRGALTGGQNNILNGGYGFIGGGAFNTVNGYMGMVLGGDKNTASGAYSFAAGYRANTYSNAYGSFVWSDFNEFDTWSWNPNEFVARATGGFWLATGIDGSGNFTSGARLPSGSNQWGVLSDRVSKTAFRDVDVKAIAAKVASLPIQSWQYKSQSADIRHLGPVAQDFYAAFGLGEDKRYIGTLDADGVSLAAIQGLYRMSQDQANQLKDQAVQIRELQARISALEKGGPIQKKEIQTLSIGQVFPWVGMILMAFGLGWTFRGRRVTK
jgi:hypothetical protein